MWSIIRALIFSILHHYTLMSPDHISHFPSGDPHTHASFIWTASVTATLEALVAIAAAYFAALGKIKTGEIHSNLLKHRFGLRVNE